MLYGMPYSQEIPQTSVVIADMTIQKYIQKMGQHVLELREKGVIAQSAPLGFSIHQIKPGDWVLIKSWKEESLSPRWEGPYLTLLTTDTAVRTAEKGWTHASRVKGPAEPPTETEPLTETPAESQWRIASTPGELKIKLKKD